MKRHFGPVAVGAALALTILCSSVSFAAADPPPQPAAGTLLIVAGTGPKGFAGDGGPATQAQLNLPNGLAVDGAGNLFIADFGNYRVRKVSPEGIITTAAGTGEVKLTGVGGPATSAGLRGPVALAVDAAGNLFIADTAWIDDHLDRNRVPADEHVLEVVGVAAPGLIAGKLFPKP